MSEANQLAILQAWPRAGIRDYPEQIQRAVVWWDLNLGPQDWKLTLPRYLHYVKNEKNNTRKFILKTKDNNDNRKT